MTRLPPTTSAGWGIVSIIGRQSSRDLDRVTATVRRTAASYLNRQFDSMALATTTMLREETELAASLPMQLGVK
jgi:hypothetical protein